MANGQPIDEGVLFKLYIKEKKSSAEIARLLKCSEHKVNYWLEKAVISKRSIGEAIYVKNHPTGDPFRFVPPRNATESELFGLGLGLYWGEGNRANKNIVKLGNSDPALLRRFIQFLVLFFKIKKSDLKFHLHIFTDIRPEKAMRFWTRELGVQRDQFYKPTITRTGKLGTYRKKSEHGVLTIYYANTKLRNVILALLDKFNKPL